MNEILIKIIPFLPVLLLPVLIVVGAGYHIPDQQPNSVSQRAPVSEKIEIGAAPEEKAPVSVQ